METTEHRYRELRAIAQRIMDTAEWRHPAPGELHIRADTDAIAALYRWLIANPENDGDPPDVDAPGLNLPHYS